MCMLSFLCVRIWQEQGYAESPVTYTSWLIYGFPQACMNLMLVYLWLRLLYLGLSSFKCTKSMDEEQEEAVKKVIKREYNALGPIRYVNVDERSRVSNVNKPQLNNYM